MNFDTFLNQAWADHAKNAGGVARTLSQGIDLLEKNDQIPAFANLVTHVYGEHLGQWSEGAAFLQDLAKSRHFLAGTESEKAITRSVAVLRLAGGDEKVLSGFANSDRIRILAMAASALSEQKQTDRAHAYFNQALEQAHLGLAKQDPANRALAVTGNNLACALEERTDRSDEERLLMILAAETARKFWEIAGGWKEILWAEYRLAMTYLKATDLQWAMEHAQTCLEVARENNAGGTEMFFGYEVLALVERERNNPIGFKKAVVHAEEYFAQLSGEDKAWCEESREKLMSLAK